MGTRIEWAEEVWNPITGCTKVSPGCQNCYAEAMAKRWEGMYGYPAGDPFKVVIRHDRLDQPKKWVQSRIVFVCSMGDWLHEQVPDDFIRAIFETMQAYPQHVYITLTKRVQRLVDLHIRLHAATGQWYNPPNIWWGVTAENLEWWNDRVIALQALPIANRFVSAEPLLGRIKPSNLDGLSWVIIGGESGTQARPMHPQWALDIVEACKDAKVPVFFKQWGGWAPWQPAGKSIMTRINLAGRKGTNEKDAVNMFRIGKKAAGATLPYYGLIQQYPQAMLDHLQDACYNPD